MEVFFSKSDKLSRQYLKSSHFILEFIQNWQLKQIFPLMKVEYCIYILTYDLRKKSMINTMYTKVRECPQVATTIQCRLWSHQGHQHLMASLPFAVLYTDTTLLTNESLSGRPFVCRIGLQVGCCTLHAYSSTVWYKISHTEFELAGGKGERSEHNFNFWSHSFVSLNVCTLNARK